MGKVIGVRFNRGAKIYDFDAGHFVLSSGDMVIVETEQGLALGEVVRPPALRREDDDQPELKRVYRLATDEDREQVAQNQQLEKEAFTHCAERIAALKLDMNLVKVDCLFDRSKIIFYFTAEGRQDFRELVRDMVARLRMRVEMRQIGVRHEAKLLGGLGSCGRELCCCTFLRDFEPVSVKMAKEQNLSLNPTKISGLCGRLMCCLTYEYETYRDLKKDLPKLGKRFTLADGSEVKVIRQNVLQRQVTLYTPEGEKVVGADEFKEMISPAPADQASSEPERGRSRRRRRRKGGSR